MHKVHTSAAKNKPIPSIKWIIFWDKYGFDWRHMSFPNEIEFVWLLSNQMSFILYLPECMWPSLHHLTHRASTITSINAYNQDPGESTDIQYSPSLALWFQTAEDLGRIGVCLLLDLLAIAVYLLNKEPMLNVIYPSTVVLQTEIGRQIENRKEIWQMSPQ